MRKIIVGDVNLNILNLVEILDLSDVEVKGRFNCTTNYLTSLKGSPHTAREFMCTGNLLTNLIGGPHTVKWNYWCSFTQITSLEGAPATIGRQFWCHDNNLKSLKGAPITVGKSFSCYNNPLVSLEGIPTKIGQNLYIDKKLKSRFPENYIRSLSNIEGKVKYIDNM